MRSNRTLKSEDKSLFYSLGIAFFGACVVATTLLNVAFTLMPTTMVHILKTVLA